MRQLIVPILTLLLTLTACDPLETGPAPTLSGVSKSAVNQSQIQVSWSATGLGPDGVEKENLHFGIWVAKHSDGLNTNNLGDPTYQTGEGALSYTIVGLSADTEYDILVRAANRGNVFSANTDVGSAVRTLVSGGGSLGSAVKTTLTDQPLKILTGNIGSATAGNVGLVYSSGLQFYKFASGGTLTRENNLALNIANLRDAVAVPVTSGQKDNLFALTDNGLVYYTNGSSGLSAHAMAFEGVPVSGSLVPRLKGDILDVFSYVGTNDRAYIYQVNSSSSQPFTAHDYDTGGQDPLFAVAKLNNDAFYDLVYFRGNKLFVNLAKDDSLESFDGATELDELGTAELGTGTYLADMFVVADETGVYDIYLFIRNEGEDETRLLSYQGNGDGTFDEVQVTDYSFHFYYRPTFADVGGDGRVDLVAAQTSSNNVAVYFGPSASFGGTPTYFGIDGVPYQALAANIDGQKGPDLVVYDRNNRTLNMLYDNN